MSEQVPEDTEYKIPAQVSIGDLVSKDADDDSLNLYKKKLLGDDYNSPPIRPEDTRVCIPTLLEILIPTNNDDMAKSKEIRSILDVDNVVHFNLDLDKNKEEIIHQGNVDMKEGTFYCTRLSFYVQRDIVHGLQCKTSFFKRGIKIPGETTVMVMGSFGPKPNVQVFTSKTTMIPSGWLSQGVYKVVNKVIDDDKNKILKIVWHINVKK